MDKQIIVYPFSEILLSNKNGEPVIQAANGWIFRAAFWVKKSYTQNNTVSFYLFKTLKKTDLIYSDRKQIGHCLKPGVGYGDWLGKEK